ncbi:hypothetical protein BO71DRAFT_421007 [Aspergillus ellipticus CBS 707.79]|uniref:Zn(2)-C6 fungal-type domain-containing protein n=1 Tax=Aspergillus ellipticus CBS 707.79 TaxID=1448320 RepID=A0A319EMN2_9EURO|nr:hypothetical protein BO71DRAFT_421007 [Aspergillus ellipticus CBS 707.79]
MSRSFNGCKRCKARRQKCDEQRPSCGRCMTAGTPCRYAMQLQWGGRAFSRSRFGACVGTGGMQKLEYSPGEFIYTTNASGERTALTAPLTTITTTTTTPSSTALIRPIDPYTSLTTDQKSLFHHFLNDASQITACHSGMQRDICKMIVPMALQTPSLLYATMALSAIHLQALHNQSENVKSAPEIARFMALSLEHFRQELQNPASKGSDALLATARTLCLAEIHSGAIHPNSWRAHIEGARALMEASDNCGALSPKSPEGFRRYLDRWYRSIVSLTALTGNGPPIGEVSDQLVGAAGSAGSGGEGGQPASPDYLDDYWGFTVNLSAIFRRIGAVAWREQQAGEKEAGNSSSSGSPVQGNEVCVQSEAAALESSLQQLMEQDVVSHPAFYPGVVEGLSTECMRQLMLCNEAFQLSALIQIHRRLRKTPTSSPVVQEAVKRILECTAQIGPSPGLSPWVMLTTPLFIAGCEARGQDREHVRQLLSSLHDTIRVPNVLQSLKFLEQYWGNQLDENEGWSQFLDTSAAAFVDEDDDSPNGHDHLAYTAQFSNGTPLHSRLVSEPFIPILKSPPAIAKRPTTMALHLPTNRPPPLHIDSPRRGSGMTDPKQPKTPGHKISSFFGWRGSTSPGAESSSTEISESGRSPVPSPMPQSLPSASFSITPSTTVPFDASKPQVPVPQRNPSLSSASLLDSGSATLVTELENELREISSELAGSIRREMELEDLVERLQSDAPLDTPNRPTSDYFSDSGSSSIRYAHESGGRIEDIGKFKRTAEQERAQIKTELSQKVQEERSRRAASEAHVQILESQVHQLRRERVDLSDLSSRTKELETALEDTRRKLAEERQIKDNFEDLLTAMRVELEQLRNERDHLRDAVIPQMQQASGVSSDPSEVERLMGEIEALRIENASLAQLQGSRFASIAEEDGMSGSRTVGLGLSRSNSLARVRTRPNPPGLSRSTSLSRSNSVNTKDRNDTTPKESLADRIEDVEAQRDALHQSLRRLLDRQSHDTREYERRIQLMEMEVARAQQSPRKMGYERDVYNLRDEVNQLRQRAEDALEQKWQCEKGLAGLKMDLDRAEQETTSLRVLLQEHDITVPEDLECDRDGFAEVLATSSSLDVAYRQLQADREIAEASAAQSPMAEQGPLAESVSRTKMLALHVQRQLSSNNALRSRLAEAIGKGEREQQLSAVRINEMQARLKEMEDILLIAQQYSEEEMARHEEEVRNLEESHNAQLKRMKNGSRSPAMTLSPMPLNTPFSARSPRLDLTTSGKGMALDSAVQSETLARRVKALEKLLRDADSEMEEVVSRMNRAQIEVAELQSDRDDALRLTRKLQAEIMTERETFKTLMG